MVPANYKVAVPDEYNGLPQLQVSTDTGVTGACVRDFLCCRTARKYGANYPGIGCSLVYRHCMAG